MASDVLFYTAVGTGVLGLAGTALAIYEVIRQGETLRVLICLAIAFLVSIVSFTAREYIDSGKDLSEAGFAINCVVRVAGVFLTGIERIEYDVRTDFRFTQESARKHGQQLAVYIADLRQDLRSAPPLLGVYAPKGLISDVSGVHDSVEEDVLPLLLEPERFSGSQEDLQDTVGERLSKLAQKLENMLKDSSSDAGP